MYFISYNIDMMCIIQYVLDYDTNAPGELCSFALWRWYQERRLQLWRRTCGFEIWWCFTTPFVSLTIVLHVLVLHVLNIHGFTCFFLPVLVVLKLGETWRHLNGICIHFEVGSAEVSKKTCSTMRHPVTSSAINLAAGEMASSFIRSLKALAFLCEQVWGEVTSHMGWSPPSPTRTWVMPSSSWWHRVNHSWRPLPKP